MNPLRWLRKTGTVAQASWTSARNSRQSRAKNVRASSPLGGPVRDVETLRNLSRHLVRNDALGRRAIDALSGGVVGTGITPRIVDQKGKVIDGLAPLVTEHLCSADIDAAGRHDIFGLQRLVMREVVEGGEVIIRRRRRRSSDGLTVPLQIEVLPAEYLDETFDGRLQNGNLAVGGIEFDGRGRRVAYHIRRDHPNQTGAFTSRNVRGGTFRVLASEVLHIFRTDRAQQPRGVPWLAPVIGRMQEYSEFSGAVLLRQKVAALFAAFVKSDRDLDGMIDGEKVDGMGDSAPALFLEAGLINRLAQGEDIVFPNLPSTDGADSILMHFKRDFAAGLGLSYEVLAGDYSQGNFSSNRMGWIEHSRTIATCQKELMISQMLGPIGRWVLEAAAPLFDVEGARVKWTPPRREMLDPARERNSQVRAIDAKLLSRRTALEEEGRDVEEIDAERAEDHEREQRLFGAQTTQDNGEEDV